MQEGAESWSGRYAHILQIAQRRFAPPPGVHPKCAFRLGGFDQVLCDVPPAFVVSRVQEFCAYLFENEIMFAVLGEPNLATRIFPDLRRLNMTRQLPFTTRNARYAQQVAR